MSMYCVFFTISLCLCAQSDNRICLFERPFVSNIDSTIDNTRLTDGVANEFDFLSIVIFRESAASLRLMS